MQCQAKFLSTLSLRRATIALFDFPVVPVISIHALLAESDRLGLLGWLRTLISIHALLAESDFRQNYECFKWIKFLSTLSLRRATHQEWSGSQQPRDFYPRSPCGERHTWARGSRVTYVISIHALLAESDGIGLVFLWWGVHFYPRSPCGERPSLMSFPSNSRYFYPRSPCGERPGVLGNVVTMAHFYPRSPCGERLKEIEKLTRVTVISIHALLAESDKLIPGAQRHPPISIHALLAESDMTVML